MPTVLTESAIFVFSIGTSRYTQRVDWVSRDALHPPWGPYLDRFPSHLYLVGRFERVGGGPASPSEAVAVAGSIISLHMNAAAGSPVYAQCSLRHARAYMRLLARFGYQVEVVAGSYVGDAPVSDWTHSTGSDDEQIVRISRQIGA